MRLKRFQAVIPAWTAGIQLPWMAFVMHSLTDFYTGFYWIKYDTR